MTGQAFEKITIGAPVSDLENQVGAPYRILSKGDGEQYIYLERIQTGPSGYAQNTYILTVKNGVVINKESKEESSSLNIQVR